MSCVDECGKTDGSCILYLVAIRSSSVMKFQKTVTLEPFMTNWQDLFVIIKGLGNFEENLMA